MTHETKTIWTLTIASMASALALGCATTQTMGERMDDNRIERSIEMSMLMDDEVKAHDIDAEVVDNYVYLRGEVPNEREKAAATQIALAEEGVTGVSNQIEVQSGVEIEAWNDGDPDLWYVTAVNWKLAADPRTRSRNIDVDAWDGVVYLSGIVEDPESKRVAENLARETDGVDRVINELEVEETIVGEDVYGQR